MSGSKILDGAREALDWVHGNGAMRVSPPGQPTRDMTFYQYALHEGLLRPIREMGVTLSRSGDEIRLQFPDGTLTDAFYDALEAALAPPAPTSEP